ncbi:MAG: glycosyltransferase family 4 protein [Chloroflexota bacterium]
MTRIRILHLVNNLVDSSISRIVERIIRSLDVAQYEWHVGYLSGSGEMEAALKSLGAEIVHFSAQQAEGPVALRIREYVHERGIQIIHTHTPRTILAITRAGLKNVPHIATKHLLTKPSDRRWGVLYTAFDYVTLYLPDRIVPVSESMAAGIKALPGIRDGRVIPVRNAIPCEEFYQPERRRSTRRGLGFGPEQVVFGYTGRLDPVKRIDLLLKAFTEVLAAHPNVRLLIVGEGSQSRELEAMGRSLGIAEAVTWTGFRADIARLLAAMDVYVQPSHNEGLSLSILEAMAAGKPVIATDVGGAREVLHHRETGMLIPPRAHGALSGAMLELAQCPVLRLQLGAAAKEHVFDKFSLAKMVNAYGQIYQSLISK